MPVRICQIAAKHDGHSSALLLKAQEWGYKRIRQPSSVVDKIMAEALEKEVYGTVIPFPLKPEEPSGQTQRQNDVGNQPTERQSGAEGRLAALRGTIRAIRRLFNKSRLSEKVERQARSLCLLLDVCQSQDWRDACPPEGDEAERLLSELRQHGFQYDPSKPKESKAKRLIMGVRTLKANETSKPRKSLRAKRAKKNQRAKKRKRKGGDAMFRRLPGCFEMGKRR